MSRFALFNKNKPILPICLLFISRQQQIINNQAWNNLKGITNFNKIAAFFGKLN